MTDVVTSTPEDSADHNGAHLAPTGQTRSGMTADALRAAVSDHLIYSIARPPAVLTPEHYYKALSLAVRDRMQKRWMATTQDWLDLSCKVTCYLSAEFLMGPQLGNNNMLMCPKTLLRNSSFRRQVSKLWKLKTSNLWPPLHIMRKMILSMYPGSFPRSASNPS